jgi:hypothetical protein
MPESIVVDVAESSAGAGTPETKTSSEEAVSAEATPNTVSLELELDSIPEKFRKDPTQIFNSYGELESELGRQRNVTGTYRGLVEELSAIKREADLAQTPAAEPLNVTSDSLLENPVEAITQVVERALEAKLRPLEEATALSQQEQELAKFQRDYPSFEMDVASNEFVEFVKKRPTRLEDAQAANQGDLRAARRLMDNYEDFKQFTAPAEKTPDPTPTGVEGARKVATEVSGTSGAVSGKKVYTQKEVVDTIISDPELYRSQAYQDDLMAAMREGRYRR